MTALTDHHSSQTIKMLVVADSGAGKTGALASLAAAGYNLRIIDTDNGVDVLANLLRDKSRYPKGLENVEVETLTDKMRSVAGKLVPGSATVWDRAADILTNWGAPHFSTKKPNASAKLGPLESWTSKEVLVIDSLSTLGNAALNKVLAMNGRLGQQPHQSDWYGAQTLIEGMLQMLYAEEVPCNVIINCHIKYIGDESKNEPILGYPEAAGKALSPKVGRYFNSTVSMTTEGFGSMAKRVIITQSQPRLALKVSAPSWVKSKYPIESGLADLFKDLRGEGEKK
jgi:hypothetical protein